MIEHREPPNWVLGRSECTLNMTFEALVQIVNRDVDEANKAIEEEGVCVWMQTESGRCEAVSSPAVDRNGIIGHGMFLTTFRISCGFAGAR